MNRISLIILLFFQIIFPIQTDCQSLTDYQRRIINESLLKLINDYENYSRFTTDDKSINENYINNFNALFDKGASLYLDIIPSNKVSDPINLTDYINILKRYYSTGMGVKLHDILFDTPEFLNGSSYKINIELSKVIYGYSKTNVNYRDTIPLILTVGFIIAEDQIGDMKILGIKGDPRGRFLKFRVLKFLTLKPVKNAQIKFDSVVKRTNGQGVADFENIDPSEKHSLIISYEHYKPIIYNGLDVDRFVEGNTDEFHRRLILAYYDPNEFIFKMNTFNYSVSAVAGINFPGFKTVVSKGLNSDLEFDDFRTYGALSPRLGIRLGFLPLRTKDFDFSVNAGIEKNFLMATYKFDKYHIEYPDVDPNNDAYTRLIDLYKHRQRITLNFTEFPLLVSVTYKHFKDFDIGGNFGVRFSILNKSSCLIKSGFAISGEYPQFDTTYTKDYYDFKDIRIREKSTFHPEHSRYFSYQVGLTVSKEIYPSVKVFAGPTIFLYAHNGLNSNEILADILSEDEEINNILYTYKRSGIQSIALEFGLIYYFNSINLKRLL